MTQAKAKELIERLSMHAKVSDTCAMIPLVVIGEVTNALDKYVFTHGRCYKCDGPATKGTGCKRCGKVPACCDCPPYQESTE